MGENRLDIIERLLVKGADVTHEPSPVGSLQQGAQHRKRFERMAVDGDAAGHRVALNHLAGGSLVKLAGTAFNGVEGNSVNLQVLRVHGDDGAVSVSFSVAAGTAQAADFTAQNGTLSWADNDDNPKIIQIQTTKQKKMSIDHKMFRNG